MRLEDLLGGPDDALDDKEAEAEGAEDAEGDDVLASLLDDEAFDDDLALEEESFDEEEGGEAEGESGGARVIGSQP